jgi:hypothetical protein
MSWSAPASLGLLALLLLAAPSLAAASLPIVWQGSTEVAQGRGERGPWRQNESAYDYVDDPTVALDDRGDALVAWVDQGRKEVLFQRFSKEGATQGGTVNVSRNPTTFSWLPRLALASRDASRVYLLWQEIIFSGGSHGGDILFARSRDGGRSFSAPLNLSRSMNGDGKGRISRDHWDNGSLDLAAGPNGTLVAAWTAYEGQLFLARSTDGGETFSHPQRIAGSEAEPARAPALAIGPDDTLYVAWTVGEDRAADIRVARSQDGGLTFSAAQVVARTAGYSDAPKLAVDTQAAVHLVFGDAQRILYARSEDGARSFTRPRDISGRSGAFPHMSVDERGRLYVAWEIATDARHRPRGLGMAVSRHRGRDFSSGTVPNSADASGAPNGSFQGLLMRKLAVNRSGQVAVVNSSLLDGQRSRVWLIRGEVQP